MQRSLHIVIALVIVAVGALSSCMTAPDRDSPAGAAIKTGTAAPDICCDEEEMDIIAPSYYGTAGAPESEWTDLESNWPNWGTTSMVIINEDSGPGPAKDDTLFNNATTFLADEDGVPKILGYLNAGAPLDTAAMTTQIDHWISWYPSLSGIFFDKAARGNVTGGQASDVAQMEYVVNYAISTYHFPYMVFNTAGDYNTTQYLFDCMHQLGGFNPIFVTVEDYESNLASHASDFAPGGNLNWVHNYQATGFAGLVHDAPADGSSVNSDLTAFASYAMAFVFVTDQKESINPWEPGPAADVWSAMGNITGQGIEWSFADGTSTNYTASCPMPAQ
jgi:hypothetical protein